MWRPLFKAAEGKIHVEPVLTRVIDGMWIWSTFGFITCSRVSMLSHWFSICYFPIYFTLMIMYVISVWYIQDKVCSFKLASHTRTHTFLLRKPSGWKAALLPIVMRLSSLRYVFLIDITMIGVIYPDPPNIFWLVAVFPQCGILLSYVLQPFLTYSWLLTCMLLT